MDREQPDIDNSRFIPEWMSLFLDWLDISQTNMAIKHGQTNRDHETGWTNWPPTLAINPTVA